MLCDDYEALELNGGDGGAFKLLGRLLGDVIEVLEGASCTQRKVSMVPFVFSIPFVLSWGGSISSDSLLPSILLLVNYVLLPAPSTSGMVKVFLQFEALKSWAYAFHQDKASSVRVPVANVTLSSSTHLLRENTDSVRSNQRMRPTAPFRTIKIGRLTTHKPFVVTYYIPIGYNGKFWNLRLPEIDTEIKKVKMPIWGLVFVGSSRTGSLPSGHGMIIDESYLTLRSILHQRISWWWCKYTLTGDEDPTDSKTEYWNG
ncbi:hypothetical protein Tco_0216577 [Tanacetum coccineum]